MKRVALCLFVAASMVGAGCRTARQEVRTDYRRADSLTALVAENLCVSLHDVVITPPDSASPRIAAARVDLTRQSACRVDVSGREIAHADEAVAREPNARSWRRRLLPYAFILLAVAVLWWFRRQKFLRL